MTTTVSGDRLRTSWAGALRDLRRAVGWHRRLVAGALAAIAVLAGLQVLRPAPTAAVGVVTATRDLSAGTVLTADDLGVAHLPPGLAPGGAVGSIAAVVGSRLAAPLRSGEPLTDVRLIGAALLGTYRASIGPDVGEVLLRVADPGAVAQLRPGDHIDVIAAPTTGSAAGGPAVVVARSVPVLAVPAAPDTAATGSAAAGAGAGSATGDGGSVLVVVGSATARILAQAEVSSEISILVHPG